MTQLFYQIYKNENGRFVYDEFRSGWSWNGYSAFICNGETKEFETRAEAESYAKQRGATDAYGY